MAEKVEQKESSRRRRPLGQKTEVVEETTEPVVETRGITAPKGRATPSRRRQEEEEEETGNVVTRTGGGLVEYFEGVRAELDKVVWPTRDETIRLTIIVLATLIVSAIILGIISATFTELFRIGLGQPIILFAVMAVAVGAGFFVYRRNNSRRSY